MSTFAKKMMRLAALSLAGLIICAMIATPAAAVALTWNYASSPLNFLWSDNMNWTPNQVPTAADDVNFTNTAGVAVPAETNEVAVSTTINSLWYQQTATANIHTTQIDAGQTLKVQGFNATSPTGYTEKFSLFAGNIAAANTSVEKTVITGATSTLDVSNATNGNTTGDIMVALGFGTTGTLYPDHTAVLDLSGLGTFNANVDQLMVGATALSTTTMDRPCGLLYLANTNTITLNSALSAANPIVPGGAPLTSLPGGGLVIGYSANRSGGDPYVSAVYLGHTNTMNVDNVLVGGRFRQGLLGFASTTNGSSLTMRGSNGTSRVASITIGDNSNNSTGGNSTAGTVDLTTSGTVDVMATSIVLGQSPTNYIGVNTRNGESETGTLTFNAGTIDTTGMIVANQATNLNSTTRGTVNVSGTATLTIGANGLTMSNYNAGSVGAYWGAAAPSTSALNVSGGTVTVGAGISTNVMNGGAGPNTGITVASTISITGGAVTVGGDITKGTITASNGGTSTTTVALTGGTLDMAGHSIGTATAINTLTFGSGTLKNVAGINSLIDGTTMNKTTAGTLILDGTNTYTGDTKVSAGTLQFASTVTIASSVIDVAAGTLDVTAFDGLGGYTVPGGKTIRGNGLVNGSINIAGTLATGESPGILTVAGNINLSGIDAVEINNATAGTGYDQLVVNGATNTVALAGTLALTVSPSFIPSNDAFWIVVNNTSNSLSGTFGSYTGLPDGWTVLANVDYDTANLTPGSGNDVAIVAVPEPATLAMLIMAAGLCLFFKRFRNK